VYCETEPDFIASTAFLASFFQSA